MIRLEPPRDHVHYGTAVIRTTEPYESPATGTVYPVCRDPLCPLCRDPLYPHLNT